MTESTRRLTLEPSWTDPKEKELRLWTDLSKDDERIPLCVDAVCTWWTEKLRNRGPLDNGDLVVSAMATMLDAHGRGRPVISDETALKFNRALRSDLLVRIGSGERSIALAVDYHPDRTLTRALDAAELGTKRDWLPWKTVTWIEVPVVLARDGYRNERVPICDLRTENEKYWDLEETVNNAVTSLFFAIRGRQEVEPTRRQYWIDEMPRIRAETEEKYKLLQAGRCPELDALYAEMMERSK